LGSGIVNLEFRDEPLSVKRVEHCGNVLCVSVGKVIHSMVAHLDAVTSLAIDPSGLYLLSGSECCQTCGSAPFRNISFHNICLLYNSLCCI